MGSEVQAPLAPLLSGFHTGSNHISQATLNHAIEKIADIQRVVELRTIVNGYRELFLYQHSKAQQRTHLLFNLFITYNLI